MYEQLLPRLAPNVRAVAIDTPGFGASFRPESPPAMRDYARWILEALDAMSLESAHFFGHHTGANIAAEIAASHADRVESLMLMGVTWLDASERDAFRPMFAETYAPDDDGGYLRKNWDWVKMMQVTDDALPAVHQEFLDTTSAYEGRVQAFSAVWDQDMQALLRGLSQPMCLMCAEDEMLFRYFGPMLEALPDAESATFRGGTFAPELDSRRIAQAIVDFVSDVVS